MTEIGYAAANTVRYLNPIQTGGGLKYPQRQKCLQNSGNRKKFKKNNYKSDAVYKGRGGPYSFIERFKTKDFSNSKFVVVFLNFFRFSEF